MTPAADLFHAIDRFAEVAAFVGIAALFIVGTVLLFALLTTPRR